MTEKGNHFTMKTLDPYKANLSVLQRADQEDLENEFILSGIINKFSLQLMLSWKVFKRLLQYEGLAEAASGSPRTLIKAAYASLGCLDETLWLSMLRDRNDMTHIYNGEAARELVQRIIRQYIPEFVRVGTEIDRRYGDILDEL